MVYAAIFQINISSEVSDSNGGEDVKVGLLGCGTMGTCRWVPTTSVSEKHTTYFFMHEVRMLGSGWFRKKST